RRPLRHVIRNADSPRLVHHHLVRILPQQPPERIGLWIAIRHRLQFIPERCHRFGGKHQQILLLRGRARQHQKRELEVLLRRAPLRRDLQTSLLVHLMVVDRVVHDWRGGLIHRQQRRLKGRAPPYPPQRPLFSHFPPP